MRASPTFRQGVLALFVLLLAACGGSGSSDSSSAPPTPAARYAATAPQTAVVTLDGSASTAATGKTLTYLWALTSVPAGSTAAIANPTAVQTSLTTDLVGTYSLTLTVNDGTNSASIAFSVVTTAYTPPTILADLVEPVSGVVQLSLSTAQTGSVVAWTVDGNPIADGATVSWNTAGLADGSHVIGAQVQSITDYAIVYVSRTFQTRQTTVSFTSQTIAETGGAFTATVGAQSVNGIVRVDATLDGVALGTLATPNACVDPTGAACASAGLNGYTFTGTVGSGAHVVVVTATDGIGNQLGTQLRLNVTDVP